MNVLLVSANLQDDAFLISVRSAIHSCLHSLGHSIIESDLDQQNFDPYITLEEYRVEVKENLYTVQCQAYPDKYSPDVQAEMQKLRTADLIIVITKLVHTLAPTILLGWLQRVFPIKFAVFSQDEILHNKKFLFITEDRDTGYIQKFISHNFGGLYFSMLQPLFLSPAEELSVILHPFLNIDSWPKMQMEIFTDLIKRTKIAN